MNKALLLLLLTAFSSARVFAQSKRVDSTITIDFLKVKNYPDTARIWNKSNVKVKLININRNLFSVESSKVETNYNSEPPAIFSGIKLPSFASIKPSVNSVATDFAYTITDEQAKSFSGKNSIDPTVEIPNLMREIRRRSEKLDNSALLNTELVNLALTCGKSFDSYIIPAKITLATKYLTPYYSSDETLLRNHLNDSIAKFTTGTIELIGILNQLLTATTEAIELKLNDAKNSIIEDSICIANRVSTVEQIAKCKKHSEEMSKAIRLYEKELEKLGANKKTADETEKEIKSFIKDNKAYTLLTNFDLINSSNFTYETDVTKLKSDELSYNIKVKAEKALACQAPREKNIEIAVLNKSGFKVDFSTGVFINGGNKDFLQRDYYYKNIDSASVSIETYDRGKRALLSIGALMHLYFRNSYGVNAGLALGVSTTTGFDVLNFHAGPSIMLGRKDRIVLSGGITLRESKLLADGKEIGKKYTKSDLPEAPPLVGKFPVSGWFISVTYNWSKLVAKKAE